MKINKIYIFTLLLLILTSCFDFKDVVVPKFGDFGLLSETDELPIIAEKNLEGIYKILKSTDKFGDKAVVKFHDGVMSIYCEKNSSYMVLHCGQIDSVIILEGYWRFAQNYQVGAVNAHIKRNEGGKELLLGEKPDTIIIQGFQSDEYSIPNIPLVLQYENPLPENKSDFKIIAHRGGGRNSDRLPASENSVELMKLAEQFGANGIEIDIQFTKDKVPIVFHDENFSSRLIQGDYLIGKVGNFTYKQIITFAKLINGEHIPTLFEALDTVLYSTKLNLVWLDVKAPEVIPTLIDVQKKYMKLAKDMNRDLSIYIGIPSDEILDEVLKYDDYKNLLTLCELTTKDVEKVDAKIWAPRWTLGTQKKELNTIHDQGRKAFVWTLDDELYIKKYLKDSDFDGILTNYPSIVFYQYYSEDYKK